MIPILLFLLFNKILDFCVGIIDNRNHLYIKLPKTDLNWLTFAEVHSLSVIFQMRTK